MASSESDETLFAHTQLFVLRPNTLKLLGDYLNSPKFIPSTAGLSRDWRGLASIADLSFEETNRIESNQTKDDYNPTKQIILKWCQRNNKDTGRKITVQDFINCVTKQLDRADVIDDTNVKGKLYIS